ncbi:MAG TPA: phosphotransferase, partial [Saprospiraceae bacterium]|nr:phosphotransferase [Saprospiraceae bacterium]
NREMTSQQIQLLVDNGRFPGPKAPVEWVETHISWVILTPAFAYKIKKPVQSPFLDFSTPEKREFYCREELRLNRRLAPDMYLEVLPICADKDGLPVICSAIGGGTPIDYAVSMKRMDNHRQMDKLLRQNAVVPKDMATLAKMLVRFHRSVILRDSDVPYKAGDNRADFDDLFRLEAVCTRIFGAGAAQTLDSWRRQVGAFLDKHEVRLHRRATTGFWVEGHGDLHARNIFLLPDGPVIFDCIEFNPHFRQLDVLSELAFLCMDLDAGGHHELAEAFMAAYCREWLCIESPEDEQLFLYFKAYRANVRLKVALMELEQHRSEAIEASAKVYWALLGKYLEQLI